MWAVLLVASEYALDEDIGTHLDTLQTHVGAVEESGQGTLQVYCQKCPPWAGLRAATGARRKGKLKPRAGRLDFLEEVGEGDAHGHTLSRARLHVDNEVLGSHWLEQEVDIPSGEAQRVSARLRDLHVVYCRHGPGNAVYRGPDVTILQGTIHQMHMIKYHSPPPLVKHCPRGTCACSSTCRGAAHHDERYVALLAHGELLEEVDKGMLPQHHCIERQKVAK